MNTPRRAASRAAPATVFGMSWNLRSRNTSAAALLDRLHRGRAAGGEELGADLEAAHEAVEPFGQALGLGRGIRRRARR